MLFSLSKGAYSNRSLIRYQIEKAGRRTATAAGPGSVSPLLNPSYRAGLFGLSLDLLVFVYASK